MDFQPVDCEYERPESRRGPAVSDRRIQAVVSKKPHAYGIEPCRSITFIGR